jgi:hypothetical protein
MLFTVFSQGFFQFAGGDAKLAKANELKAAGNEYFKNKQYQKAVGRYTRVRDLDEHFHCYFPHPPTRCQGWQQLFQDRAIHLHAGGSRVHDFVPATM